jgi:hypothetical protein
MVPVLGPIQAGILTEEGRTRFAAAVADVLSWLETELVAEDGRPLDDEGRRRLRRIAWKLAEEQSGVDPAEVE